MIFYAGHGLEVGGTNYLVPVDAIIEKKLDIKNEAVSLNDILFQLEEAKNRLNIVVLDACRDNPFGDRSLSRKILGESGGLATPPSAKGLYIAYSADVGQEAMDGTGKNGTFTKYLLQNIEKDGLKLNDVFKLTRKDVEAETGGDQSPASYDKTTGDFYFQLPKEEKIIISEKDVKTDFRLTLNIFPNSAKVEFSDGKKFINGDIYRGGRKSLRIFRKGYLTKFLNIDLRKDSVLSVKLEKIKKVEAISKVGKLVWSGKNLDNFDKAYRFSTFQEAIKYYKNNFRRLEPKGEFEKTAEFEERKAEHLREKLAYIENSKSGILNSWLGEQNIKLNYNADIEEFSVTINSFLKFEIYVPLNEAKQFKQNVKSFDIFFEERKGKLWVVGAEVSDSLKYFVKFEIEDFEIERLAKLERKARAFLKYPRKYTRNYNGVVSDGYGLEWEDHKSSFYGDFNQAKNYCENLNLDGINDWRLPNLKELWYLADRSKSDPAISPVFKNVKNSEYWSNQKVTYPNHEHKNWEVDFEIGYDYWTERSENLNARCVRGKSFYEDIEFSRDSRTEIVTDKTNNLMWQDTSDTVSKNWNDAKTYCSNLILGGYSDWRLPEIEELYSITDQRKTSRPFVDSHFKNIKSDLYWSNSPVIKYSSNSCKLHFDYGNDDYSNFQSFDYFVRCVR